MSVCGKRWDDIFESAHLGNDRMTTIGFNEVVYAARRSLVK
jgi:hypothetical protein